MASIDEIEVIVLTRKSYDTLIRDLQSLARLKNEWESTRDDAFGTLPSAAIREVVAYAQMNAREWADQERDDLCDKITAWLDIWAPTAP